MDQLPTELVRAIAKVVDRKDILSFRLTCRSFAALGLPRQFEVIPVMLFRESLENLRRISENPAYRNYVLAIEYEPSILANPGTQINWIRAAKRNRGPGDSHSRYYDDQRLMQVTGYDFKSLQSAILCFPNLRGVRIISENPEKSNRFENPPLAWGDAFCSMAKIMGKPDHFFESEYRYVARGINAGLAACKLAQKPLSWFHCEIFGPEILYYKWDPVQVFSFTRFVKDPKEDLGVTHTLVCGAFESLTSVKLQLSRGRQGYGWSYRQKDLATALGGAQRLEMLCIQGYPMYHAPDSYPFSFNSLLDSCTWPHLKNLSLSSIAVREQDLPLSSPATPHSTHTPSAAPMPPTSAMPHPPPFRVPRTPLAPAAVPYP
ncbi:hypothetical protein ACLOAV_010511 [Pseudogymnoascus australis]